MVSHRLRAVHPVALGRAHFPAQQYMKNIWPIIGFAAFIATGVRLIYLFGSYQLKSDKLQQLERRVEILELAIRP